MEGQSYNYSTPAWEGPETEHRFTNLDDNAKYFFVVRAADYYAESSNSLEISVIGPNHTDLDPQYDRGWGITTGALKGFMLQYHSNDPPPTLSTFSGFPELNIPGVRGVGIPLHLETLPSGVTFNPPVKILIPCPGYANVNNVDLYYYDDIKMDWYLANDADDPDTVQPDASDWMVERSRRNHNFSDDPANDPSTIEIQVKHFSGVQAGTTSQDSNSEGGGCFIATAAF